MTAKIRAQLPKGFSRLFRVRGFVRRGLEPSFAATFARAMPVRIRLARYGHRNLPFYRIYVADSRAPRDGRHIEIIGHYDPKPEIDGNKHMGLKIDRAKYWLSVGAQPSDTVARLFGQAGIIPAPPRKGVGARKAPWTRGFAASAAR